MRSGFWFSCFLLGCGGCALAAYATLTRASALMLPEAKDTRRAVLKRVPVGSTPAAAQAVMEAEGFTCTQMTGTAFSVTDPDSGAPVPHAATDVLACDSGSRGFLLTKRWQVMFVDAGGSVASVAVNADLSGP